MTTAKKPASSPDEKTAKKTPVAPAAKGAKAVKAAKPKAAKEAKEPKEPKEPKAPKAPKAPKVPKVKGAKPARAAKAKAPSADAAPRRDGPAPTPPQNGKALLIVESPAKARTIKKYLGRGYTVKASVGHILDLPKSKIGVDTENGFLPEYVIIRGKGKVIEEIRDSAANVETVYLAPDPDREGEAIAWHLASQLRDVNRNVKRVLINEITKKGVTAAIAAHTTLDQNKYDAQQARRVLDRLVGYQISPILWTKVMRGLSAGRVQSVATRLVVEREREVGAFRPEEYWTVDVLCDGPVPPTFAAKLHKWKGEKAELQTGAQADEIVRELKAGSAAVEKVERKERKKNPAPPFITSRLQQEAARKLRFTAKKTMALAQRLYEGVDLGEDGPVGLITYMRTDSVRLSDDAVTEAREWVTERFGAEFLPAVPNVYKSAKQAQGAHEAIRPTTMKYDPETVRKLIVEPLLARKRAGEVSEATEHDLPDFEDYLKLYTLIWNRFIACQMAPAVYDQTAVDVVRGQAMLRATGQIMKFAGFTRVYTEAEGDDDKGADKDNSEDKLLPPLAEGDAITLKTVTPEQHFTQPPPRFSEASLVKELEDKGIGRPSTYANILSTIQDRGYVEKREARFYPTELGTLVNDLLVDAFPDILNATFTAGMEENLDKVEEGTADWVKVLQGFYEPFKLDLASAEANMRDVKREEIPTEHVCEKCGNPMVIKWGRNGSFLACKNYPECKNTKEFKKREDGTVEIQEAPTTDEKCETCGADMLHKRGRFGEFLACSKYPECKTTKPISVGVNCPKPDCGGYLTEKRSRKGRVFFGCSNYSKTKCDFVVWDRPIPTPCPNCAAPFLVKRVLRRGTSIKCVTKDCGYMQSEGEPTEDAA